MFNSKFKNNLKKSDLKYTTINIEKEIQNFINDKTSCNNFINKFLQLNNECNKYLFFEYFLTYLNMRKNQEIFEILNKNKIWDKNGLKNLFKELLLKKCICKKMISISK